MYISVKLVLANDLAARGTLVIENVGESGEETFRLTAEESAGYLKVVLKEMRKDIDRAMEDLARREQMIEGSRAGE